jgi:hypothetical protein
MAWFITFGGEDRRRNGKRKTCGVSWEQMKQPKPNGELGFRDIEIFILALLAWQAKRILQNLDTLSALFFKAVYFLEGDFLEAQIGSHPSSIWRSVIDGRDSLKQGLI